MTTQMLVAEENEVVVQEVINSIVRNYFTQLVKVGTADNYSDIVIDLVIDADKEYLRAVNRITKEIYSEIAEISYTEKTFIVISKFIDNENLINRTFTFCLN